MNNAHLALGHKVHETVQLEIVRSVWDRECLPHQLRLYQSYLEHFRNEIVRLQQNLKYRQLPSLASDLEVKDLICVMQFLSDNRDIDVSNLLFKAGIDLKLFQGRKEEVQKVIELSLRAFLTVNVRSDGDARTDAPRIVMPKQGISLSTFLSGVFPKADPAIASSQRFTPDFKIASIVEGCGLKIIWTTCLADHLRVDRAKKTVRIYHLKQCLDDHLKGRGSIFLSKDPLLPVDLLTETIWTLNLLFPEDQATAELLKRHRHHHMLSNTPGSGQKPLDLNTFDWRGDVRRPFDVAVYKHWGERLLDLMSIYEEGPTTLRQYLAYQKPYQVFNWVAALITSVALALVFGLISSVTSIISTHATLKALDVAREALEFQKNTPPCVCA